MSDEGGVDLKDSEEVLIEKQSLYEFQEILGAFMSLEEWLAELGVVQKQRRNLEPFLARETHLETRSYS